MDALRPEPIDANSVTIVAKDGPAAISIPFTRLPESLEPLCVAEPAAAPPSETAKVQFATRAVDAVYRFYSEVQKLRKPEDKLCGADMQFGSQMLPIYVRNKPIPGVTPPECLKHLGATFRSGKSARDHAQKTMKRICNRLWQDYRPFNGFIVPTCGPGWKRHMSKRYQSDVAEINEWSLAWFFSLILQVCDSLPPRGAMQTIEVIRRFDGPLYDMQCWINYQPKEGILPCKDAALSSPAAPAAD